MNILDTIDDRQVFAAWFDRGEWAAWRAFLAVLFGLELSDEQRALAEQHTGRSRFPSDPFGEAWLVVGRRGGKSFIIALIGAFLAAFRDYREFLAPGERAVVMILASDRHQARVVYRYIGAFFRLVPMLAGLVERETAEGVQLSTGVDVEIHTASFRSVRGYTLAAVLADETAYWRSDESANPDTEILEALRPGMATIPGAMLLAIGSPYAKRGAMWEAYRRGFGQDDSEILVWQADSRTMNPTLDQRVVDRAFERDPERARAEFGAQFRSDLEAFVSQDVVDRAVVPGREEEPPEQYIDYIGFTDPSGGARDSFTLAIAHSMDDGRVVLDCVRERRPPFEPEEVVGEFADVLRRYGCHSVSGDRYSAEWVRSAFVNAGIEYRVSERNKSELYLELMGPLNSGRVELLDNKRLLMQLVGLERKTARGGRDSVDHGPRGHDDVINAAAGALVNAARDTAIDPNEFRAIERDYSALGYSPHEVRELQEQRAEASYHLDEFLHGGM